MPYYPNPNYLQQPLITHWDGRNWVVDNQVSFSAGGDILNIEVVSSTDVWAVGYYYPDKSSGAHALMMHWNGSRWNSMPVDKLRPGVFADTISVISSNDVWAAGSDGDVAATMHWDGTTWKQVSIPASVSKVLSEISGLAAVSSTDVWAGGYIRAEETSSIVLHWDGTSWTEVKLPTALPEQAIYDLAGSNSKGIWLVAQAKKDGKYVGLAAHFSGTFCSKLRPSILVPGNTWFVISLVASRTT